VKKEEKLVLHSRESLTYLLSHKTNNNSNLCRSSSLSKAQSESCKSSSRALSARVEGTTTIMRFVVLAIAEFDDSRAR
jgi:hypothetical protein